MQKVDQFRPFLNWKEYEAIKDCFKTKWFTEGPKSKEFVEKLCDLIGAKYGVLAPNGTLALFLGLLALDIKPEEEVIVPDFTFIASATSVCLAGAKPIFVDINKDTLQIDIDKCEKVLTLKTKAIMPVHIYGMACDMDKVAFFARKHNLKIIEDAAQAIGVQWDGKCCGNFGDVGCFSFFADKTLTTIEGGLVVTDNEDLYKKLCLLRNQGRMDRGSFIHSEIGFNFRMNDLQSAIGLVQLDKLNFIKERKNNIIKLYEDLLKDIDQIKIIKPDGESKSNHIPFRVCISCNDKKDDLAFFMQSKGIGIRTFFYPLHMQPCFKYLEYNDEDFENSIYAFEHGLCLPSYPSMEDKKIKHVCDVIKKYFNRRKKIS